MQSTGHEVFGSLRDPHLANFEGDSCYPDVASIPGGVDGVVVIARPNATQQIVRQYRPGVDFGHKCMRWVLGIAGGLPK